MNLRGQQPQGNLSNVIGFGHEPNPSQIIFIQHRIAGATVFLCELSDMSMLCVLS